MQEAFYYGELTGSVPTRQRLLIADLTQGVCHERDGCALMPGLGAPNYTLSNLEHPVIAGLIPAWFKDGQEAFYYGELTGGWLVIQVIVWLGWLCILLHPPPVVAPGPAANVFTTVLSSTPRYGEPSFPVVTETPFTTAPSAIEDHHVDAQPLQETAVGGDVAVEL